MHGCSAAGGYYIHLSQDATAAAAAVEGCHDLDLWLNLTTWRAGAALGKAKALPQLDASDDGQEDDAERLGTRRLSKARCQADSADFGSRPTGELNLWIVA